MSQDTNPQNFRGATLTLVGYVATEPRYPAYDRDGKRGWKQIPIANNEGYKKDGEFVQTGTTWYDVEVSEDYLNENPIGKGDLIRVDDAKQEVRTYQGKDGDEKLGITLKYANITVLESKSGGSADDDSSPF